MRKILVIIPFTVDSDLAQSHSQYLEQHLREDTTISLISLKNGPTLEEYESLGSEYGLQEILDIVRRAQADYDGIMVSCFEDPGVLQARAISGIPIAGPCESALFTASLWGQKFFVISPDEPAEQLCRNRVDAMGLNDRFGAFKLVQFDVPEFADNERKLIDEICAIIDGAHRDGSGGVAILGCTAFGPLHAAIQQQVETPVIDAAAAAIRSLETAIDSRRSSRPGAGPQLRPEVQQ